jgi:sugar-specific transcriptional regulator TrmB
MESDHAMLNMNKYEWVTYNTLIDIGQSKALRISRESNVPHGKIYEVLESLKEKGLIDIIPLKIKEFIANDPEIILQLIEEKSHRIHSVKKNILQLKKTFEENTQIDNSDILIRQGLKGFYTILEMMEAPKNINYSVKWSSEYNREWAEKQKKQIDDGTDVKVLTRYDEETQGDVNKYLKYNKNIKRIENKSVALSIHDEEVLISLPQTNSTILIKDIAFTNLMQSFFNAKYKNSPEINIDKNSKIKTIKKYKSKEMINIDIINTI